MCKNLVRANLFRRELSSAMSMVEILVVMLIFVIIASIGVQAITDFKKGTELAAALSQFESTVLTVQNNARNNVLSRTGEEDEIELDDDFDEIFKLRVAGYLINFSNNEYDVRSCVKDSVDPNFINCSTIEPFFLADSANIDFEVADSGCHAVYFETLSGNMKLAKVSLSGTLNAIPVADLQNGLECFITVEHRNARNRSQEFKFNSTNNIFERISN
jgi:type II secretory pathway pseudopilin PulG